MLCVIPVMATLAKGTEIFGTAIAGLMIEVGYGEYDFRHALCFVVKAQCVVLHAAELTVIVGAFQYGLSNLSPIGGIELSVFWLYWHLILVFTCSN